jgi:hypothetical protein
MRGGGEHLLRRNLKLGGDALRDIGPDLLAEGNLIRADQHRARGAVVDDDGAGVEAIANPIAFRRDRGDIDPCRAHAESAGLCRGRLLGGLQSRQDARHREAGDQSAGP